MIEPNKIAYPLIVYSTDYRWTGETLLPLHRRLSDLINDRTLVAVVLNHATIAVWENDSVHELQKVESIVLFKQNMTMVIPGSDSSSSSAPSLDRVQKVPLRVTIHLSSFTVMGEFNLHPGADWLQVVTSANEDFLPVTRASIWRTRTRTQVESNLKFLLVNRQGIQGFEVSK